MSSVEDLDVVSPIIDIDAPDEISVLPIIKLESDVNGNRSVNEDPINVIDDDEHEWKGVTVYDIDDDLDSDSKIAKELDESINEETVEVVEVDSDLEFARKLQRKYDKEATKRRGAAGDDDVVIDITEPNEIVEIPDDDEEVPVVASTSRGSDDVAAVGSSRRNRPPSGVESSRRNRQSSTLASSATVDDELIFTGRSTINFIIEELGIEYDQATSFDWKKHEMKINVTSIFQHFSKIYFNQAECFANVEIGWSALDHKPVRLRLLPDKTQISLNNHLKLVPRIDFITHLLRVMLMLFIREKYGLSNNHPAFKRNLVKALRHVNITWHTSIKENSIVQFNHELDKRAWYRCTGICQGRAPFYGILRSSSEPGGDNSWWMTHRTDCSATLFRLYEVTKYIGKTPVEEDRFFVTNVKHRSVKVDLNTANKQYLTPTETIDLDDDNVRAPSSSGEDPYNEIFENQRTNDLMNGHRLTDPVDRVGLKPAEDFIKLFDRSLGLTYDGFEVPCPICKEKIGRRLFAEHFDGCMGFSEKIEPKPVKVHLLDTVSAKRARYY